jgi:hypothetical protein
MVYDDSMPITPQAQEAATRAKRLKRLRRLATVLRDEGWTVVEPLAEDIPTDPRHYSDRCSACGNLYLKTHGTSLGLSFACVPVEIDFSDQIRCWYQCPAGHTWKVTYNLNREGYFSDCPCTYCFSKRSLNGDKHYVRPPRYTDPNSPTVTAMQSLI